MPTPSAPTAHTLAPAAPRIFGLPAIALASLVGGPLATWWLVDRNTVALGLARERGLAAGVFAVASVLWFWVLCHVPPDALSEFIPHVLQLLPWTLFTVHLLRRHHQAHRAAGGTFRSAWTAFGFALLVAIALRVLVRLLISALH